MGTGRSWSHRSGSRGVQARLEATEVRTRSDLLTRSQRFIGRDSAINWAIQRFLRQGQDLRQESELFDRIGGVVGHPSDARVENSLRKRRAAND